jgi:hypothetical protein
MYDTTMLDEILMIAILAVSIVYIAIKGDLFGGW